MSDIFFKGDILKKLFPALFIQFSLVASYVILHDLKTHTLLELNLFHATTALHAWAGLPLSLVFLMFYVKATNVFERRYHLTIFLVPFLVFFGLYGFIFQGGLNHLHMSPGRLSSLIATYPGFEGLLTLCAHWSSSLFVALIDLWASLVVGVLFWQFMNDAHTPRQAQASYPLLGLGVSFSLMVGYGFVALLHTCIKTYDSFLKIGVCAVLFLGFLTLFAQRKCGKFIYSLEKSEEKLQLTFFQSMGYIFTSKPLFMISSLVLLFGLILGLMKELMFILRHDTFVSLGGAMLPSVFSKIMENFAGVWGFVLSVPCALLSFKLLQKKDGLLKVGMVTPALVLFLCLFLFMAFGCQQSSSSSGFLLGILSLGTLLMVQLKFFFFKPVKEISYMVLDRETQVKGRGFIDMGLERFVVAVSPLFSMVVLSLSGKLFPSLSFPVALIIAVSVLCILYVFCLRSLSAYFEKRES